VSPQTHLSLKLGSYCGRKSWMEHPFWGFFYDFLVIRPAT
jgi:hypothetical protein